MPTRKSQRSLPAMAPASALLFALLLALTSVCTGVQNHLPYSKEDLLSEAALVSLFDRWNAQHGKHYTPDQKDEKHRRFHIFRKNLMHIEHHNSHAGASFRLGLNRFADLTHEEFVASRRLGLKASVPRLASLRRKRIPTISISRADLPDSIDWRAHGAVTPAKDQGLCGSCWAFSAAGAIEGINALVTGTLVSLSVQELVTCDYVGQCVGCNGGLMDDAFKWVIRNGGIATEEVYPYESSSGDPGVCNTKLQGEEKTVTIDGYVDVESYSKNALMTAVAQQPVSIAIDASALDFQLYLEGVYNGSCSNDPYAVNHGVLLVGYGSEDGVDYWIVKNSWGESWGDEGFLRMIRNEDPFGICAIQTMSSYPTKNIVSNSMLIAES